MGEKQVFQPLTREDKITVLIYRTGILLSTIIICGLAYLSVVSPGPDAPGIRAVDILVYGLYASVGMSVFFIHLYVGAFKRFLVGLYLVGVVCLAALFFIGKGSVSGALAQRASGALLLLPLSGCLGFVTAKEAFCFRLVEGYLLAAIMPLCLLLASAGVLSGRTAASGLLFVSTLLVVFTLRKVSMPIAYDIGDKTAYR